MKTSIFIIIAALVLISPAAARDLEKGYLGIAPSILFEPYDDYNAVEINVLPFSFETRAPKNLSLQMRTMLNLRLISGEPAALSHLGGTAVMFIHPDKTFKWLSFQGGPYMSYTWNLADEQNTITAGLEGGINFSPLENFLIMMTLQPGVNWYPDVRSKELAGTASGFLPHFGIIIQAGWEI